MSSYNMMASTKAIETRIYIIHTYSDHYYIFIFIFIDAYGIFIFSLFFLRCFNSIINYDFIANGVNGEKLKMQQINENDRQWIDARTRPQLLKMTMTEFHYICFVFHKICGVPTPRHSRIQFLIDNIVPAKSMILFMCKTKKKRCREPP